MTRFYKGVRTSNVTNDNSVVEIIAGVKGCRLWGAYITLVTAVVTVVGLGRPAAKGVTPTTPTAFVTADGVGDASQTQTALAWATSPTAPATFMHRLSFGGVIGSAGSFLFPQGVFIPSGATLVIHNVVGGATLDIGLDISE